MTDKAKIEKILFLLTGNTVSILAQEGRLKNDSERIGALIFANEVFKKAYKIARGEK